MTVLEAGEKHQELLDELLSDVEAYNSELDRDLLARAFRFAADAHEGQQRRSGEAFVGHPWGAAKILAELRQDEQTIAAALLHDVVEDTDTEIDEVLTEFGDEIAQLVEGVTKLTRIHFQSREQAEAENYRKMIAAMVGDERVILIKLADRLHNMRTIEYLGKQKQLQKARETLEVYAPLAHRLGIHALKWEPEDLAFETLHPRKYEEIKAMVAERRTDREEHVSEASRILQLELDKVDIPADISGRAKHFFSIYDKMAKKGREFNEIYDLTAMRVIVERSGDEGTRDCYGALGLIHSLWKPMPGRFKDYVAMPKFNGYRALHTTVIGPQGRPLAIQARTRDVHETAEFGVAAPWPHHGRQAQTDPRRRPEAHEHALKQQNLPYAKLRGSATLAQVIRETGFKKAEDFYLALGSGKLQPGAIVNKVVQRLKTEEVAAEAPVVTKSPKTQPVSGSDMGVVVPGVSDVLVRLAKCCTP